MKLNLWRLFQPAEYIQLGRPSSLPCLAEDKSAIKRPRIERATVDKQTPSQSGRTKSLET